MNTRKHRLARFISCIGIVSVGFTATIASGQSASDDKAETPEVPTVAETEKTSWQQLHQLAQQLEAGAYMYVSEDAVLFSSGEAVDYSGRDEEGIHESGTTLDSGVWFFPENSIIQWPDGVVQILQNDTVVVPRSDLNVQTASSGKGSSIECQEGFWACCNLTNALCVRHVNIGNHTCQSGGEGAVACSISDSL